MPKIPQERMSEFFKRLGKEKDIGLAREFGISRQNVSKHRKARNIPMFKSEPPLLHPVPVCFTGKDDREIKQSMNKLKETNRSGYIRGAVRDKNKEVLGK